jgi:hypothetical protein
MDQYNWSPCTSKLRAASFNTEKQIFPMKTGYLNEEINCSVQSRHYMLVS